MKNKGKKIGVATALFSCWAAAQAGISWGIVGFGAGQSMDPLDALKEAAATDGPMRDVEWATVAGTDKVSNPDWAKCGKGLGFCMGTDSGGPDAKPVHEVALQTFQMSKTLVTVEQYAACVSTGRCSLPKTGNYCNWGRADRARHPINCVTWDQARQYAQFKATRPGFWGSRLPSESEWEYAARSEGRSVIYPWGSGEPTCDTAVMYGNGGYGCGNDSTLPVCSRTAGNTDEGLCDMAGNLSEWVEDVYRASYAGAPADGRPYEGSGHDRATRGGSFKNGVASYLRTDARGSEDPAHSYVLVGFRLARSNP